MKNELICANCGTTSKGKRDTKGSFWIELILWCCLFLPGFIYSIWRLTTRGRKCPVCGNRDLIPIETPRGRTLANQFTDQEKHYPRGAS